MKTITASQAFLNNRRALNLSPLTIAAYSQLLTHFNSIYPKLPTIQGDIEAYIAGLVKAHRSEATVYDYFIRLQAFYHWAGEQYNLKNPMAKLRHPRLTKKLRSTMEPDEVWRVINLATDRRDHAILCLLADNGIRADELCSLRQCDIGEDTIKVIGKTGQREVPISEGTRRLLIDLSAGIGRYDHIFRGHKGALKRNHIYDIVHKYLVAAGIPGPKLGPHRIRHAFGKGYLMAGGDVRSLQLIMGYANITTTQLYTSLTQGDLVAKHHQFTLLRSAQAAAQGSFLDKAGVLKEAEEILQNNTRR